jgi:hypothetical protein
MKTETLRIIGYPCPYNATSLTIPARPGWEPVSFTRMAFGVSVIWRLKDER